MGRVLHEHADLLGPTGGEHPRAGVTAYPSWTIAASTRAFVVGATLGCPLRTRDTVRWDTPARCGA